MLIQHAEAEQLSKVVNIMNSIVWRETPFVYKMNMLATCAGAFQVGYGFISLDERTKHIVDDTQ